MENRAGHFKQNKTKDPVYYSFVPKPMPPSPRVELTEEIITLLINANSRLLALESVIDHIPDKNLFVSMYVLKEALMSSQIEGTQATLEDVLDPMLEENANRNVTEVINYVKASEYAIERLNTLPLSNRLIKEVHKILMDGVRGQESNPGEFRHSQNWVGRSGSTLSNATFIPPTPADMKSAMSELEQYIHKSDEIFLLGSDLNQFFLTADKIDPLIKIALIHYQFETIHPFLDGNGRIGRLLILLYLLEKKILSAPILYISYFLKANRTEYYDRLMEVRLKGHFEQWVQFFLHAVLESAIDALNKITRFSSLFGNHLRLIQEYKGSKNIMRVFEYIKANPIIEINKTAVALELSYNTIATVVKILVEMQILVQVDSKKRNRVFMYESYLEILREGTN